MLQNILSGLGGGGGFLQQLMGGKDQQNNGLMSMLGMGPGLLSQPGQSPLQTFGNMMQPMGLLQMIMKGLQ